ncbi:MAG: hypothetical protein SWY16_05095 [Cyanobacteriota bacterium]|nr:hypothetical protein [Cyanobacteriota bacterium]
MADSLFFFFGFGAIFLGFKTPEDVHKVALIATGLICWIWGFSISSILLQLLFTIFLTGFIMLLS